MKKEAAKDGHFENSRKGRPYKVRLPKFITDKENGLGSIIKRTTSSIGIRPCTGCEHRAAVLNNWFVFSGRR